MKTNTSILWAIAFLAIFLLTQDYLFVTWRTDLWFFGLPNWLVWFAFVHVLFLLFFYVFIKKFWKEKK